MLRLTLVVPFRRERRKLESQMGTLQYRALHDIMIIAHNEEAPADAEWTKLVEELRTLDPFRGVFVITDGGAPNASQRTALATLKGSYKAAVLSPSKVIQLISKAISWFGVNIRVYGIGEHREALKFLEIPHADQQPILESTADLRLALAGMGSFETWRARAALDYDTALQDALTVPIRSLSQIRRSQSV
jgi:hypothetical protein